MCSSLKKDNRRKIVKLNGMSSSINLLIFYSSLAFFHKSVSSRCEESLNYRMSSEVIIRLASLCDQTASHLKNRSQTSSNKPKNIGKSSNKLIYKTRKNYLLVVMQWVRFKSLKKGIMKHTTNLTHKEQQNLNTLFKKLNAINRDNSLRSRKIAGASLNV